MKFCILQTEVDKETLDFLYENGYPIDRIQTEDGEYMYKTPALLCKNFKVNDEIRTYSLRTQKEKKEFIKQEIY